MREYLIIRDTITGKVLQVLKSSPDIDYIIITDIADPAVVKRRSVGKVIRTWMKGVKSDNC